MKEVLILNEPTGQILEARSLFKATKKINIDYTQENFIVFYLNTKNQVIDAEIVFKGGLNSCIICPKTIFRKALLKNSNSIIIAHNHPSECLEPSDADKDIFRYLKEAGELLLIKVLDSIIFNKKEFYSIKEANWKWKQNKLMRIEH